MTLYSAAHSVKLWLENVSYVAVECCQDSTADSLHVLLSCWRVSPQCGWRRSHNATCIHAVYTRSIEPHVGSVVRVVKCVSQLHIKQIDFDPFNNHFECQVELTQTLSMWYKHVGVKKYFKKIEGKIFFNFKTGQFDPQHKRPVNHWLLSPDPQTCCGRRPPLPKPGSTGGFFLLRGRFFPSYCYQVLAHRGSSDC